MSSIKKAKLVQDSVYPEMWRVKWPDGVVSDMVNKTRAKDAIRCREIYELRFPINSHEEGVRKVAGAFK